MQRYTGTYLEHLNAVHYVKKETSLEEAVHMLDLIEKIPRPGMLQDVSFFAIDYSKEELKSRPPAQHGDLTFSHNFRLKSKQKTWNTYLQTGKIITDLKTGIPLFSYGYASNITNGKRDHSMIQIIDKTDPVTNMVTRLSTNYYFPCEEDTLLTKREKEIVFWLAEGYSNKQIADKLFVSDFTINNHRANIMRKTNSKNVAHLVAFAIRKGII